MKQKLLVYIDESWPNHASAPWVLLDDRDRVIEEGQSEPRHWPTAAACEVVLSGTQCAWLETTLPAGKRGEQQRLLRYALEDQLIRDVDEQHLTVTGRVKADGGVRVAVLVIARHRLRSVLAQFDALGRKLTRVVCELQASATSPDSLCVAIGPTGLWIIHAPGKLAMASDADGASDLLALFAHSALQSGTSNCSMTICCTAEHQTPDLAALSRIVGQAALVGPRYAWWAKHGTSTDLLHDEFGTRGSGGWHRKLKLPALISTGALTALLLATVIEVTVQRQQLGNLEDRIRRLFETSVPNTPAIMPAVQLRRSLDDIRARYGQLREDDLLALLDSFADVGGAETRNAITRIEYENGALKLTFAADRVNDPALLAARLGVAGFQTIAQGDLTMNVSRKATQ